MAASALSAVTERLNYLLQGEGLQELHEIREFLLGLDLDGMNNNSDGDTQKKVKKLAYDIEDAIDARLEAVKSGGGILSSILKSFSDRSFRHDLHNLKRRMDELKPLIGDNIYLPKRDAGPISPGERSNRSSTSTSTSTLPSGGQLVHKTTSKNSSLIVGMESQRLKESLVDNTIFSVIAICGDGGLGKTTLAKMVYNDSLTVHHFDYRAWAYVGMDFQARDILENILFDLSSWTGRSKQEIAQMHTMQLMEQLYRSLKGKRYLVVLDDLWSAEAWETIGVAFPKDNNGSRVVITTRDSIVAAQRARNLYIHELKMLSLDDSWTLFKMQSGLQDDDVRGKETEAVGKQIINQCKGIPLAIVVVGRLLRGKKLEYWNEVQHRLQQAQNPGVNDTLDLLLDLSYNQLPFYLKQCFLYLGHFPPDQEILVEKLYLLWIAEGIISTKHWRNKSRLMDIAEDYLNELAERSLVMLQNEEFAGTTMIKSCHLHDLIRDICILKGKQEEFFSVVYFGYVKERIPKTRRLAIYLNKHKHESGDGVALSIPEPKFIRSLLFFDTDEHLPKSVWPKEFTDLKDFILTRVLDFDGVNFRVKMLPKNIEKLFHLRYLSFRGCYLKKFPSYLSNFPFLETLDLRVRRRGRMIIPNVVRKFLRLKHLYFPEEFRSDRQDKLKLDELTMLEILVNFDAGICDANDLLQLKILYIFTGIVDGNTRDLDTIRNFIKDNEVLRHSSLVVRNFDSYSNQRLSIVKDLLKCGALFALDIHGYLGTLPRHYEISSNFTKMVFNGSEFNEDPMPILGKLPRLRSLVLSCDAFVGKEMVCSESDFRELRNLELRILNSLEKWEVEKGAMPTLTTLTIEQCKKLQLQILPAELMKITTLQEIRIGPMPENFKKTVKKGSFANDELRVTFSDY